VKLAFVVEGRPQPKQRARRGLGGRWFTPRETREFHERVLYAGLHARQLLLRTSGRAWPLDATYRVTCWPTWSDRRRRDLDNLVKAVLDGLNGVLWQDDSQVSDQRGVRTEPGPERTRVEVEVLAP